jgi:heme exporter protein C
MPGAMRLTFLIALAGMALLFVTLWKYEMASKNASAQLRALRAKLAGGAA